MGAGLAIALVVIGVTLPCSTRAARFEWGTQYGPFGGFLRRRGPSPVRCPRPRMVARSGISRESVRAGPP